MALPHLKNSPFNIKIKNEMRNKQQIIDILTDAVNTSGKNFIDISKESIYNFLKKEGVPSNTWDDIYDTLSYQYGGPAAIRNRRTDDQKEKKISDVVDYSNNDHNDVKLRQPRKSIFGDIVVLKD